MKLKVTQKASTSKRQDTFARTLKGLGLRGPNSSVVVANTPSFRGAIKKVIHLVRVEEVQ